MTTVNFNTILTKLVILGTKYPASLDKIRNFIRTYPESLNTKDEKGFTALMYACIYSNTDSTIEIIELLIECGADVS